MQTQKKRYSSAKDVAEAIRNIKSNLEYVQTSVNDPSEPTAQTKESHKTQISH